MGMEKFCAAAAEAGADGVLLTDMIVEEAGEYLESMRAHQLAPIFLAAPTSPDARLKAIAQSSQGFVYAISRVGITGTQRQQIARRRRTGALTSLACASSPSHPNSPSLSASGISNSRTRKIRRHLRRRRQSSAAPSSPSSKRPHPIKPPLP